MTAVRKASRAYTGLSRTKDQGCSRKVQVGAVCPPALYLRHVMGIPSVSSPEQISEREALQLGRQTQGRCEELGLVTATGILETRNLSAR
ncbi:hypothetical protein TNCV_260541 [Trichonephila clavipes]|nr:hypothetical protein TNCV_260541 [Trichonephila clavipes]